MKISKIVSAAILSVAVSSSAFGAGEAASSGSALEFFKLAQQKLADIAKNKESLANNLSDINNEAVKGAFKAILDAAKNLDLTTPRAFKLGKTFGPGKDETVTLTLQKNGANPEILLSSSKNGIDGKAHDIIKINADNIALTAREINTVTPILKNFKDQNDITHDAGIGDDIKANNKNKAMIEYLSLITSETGDVFKFLITDNDRIPNPEQLTENALTQTGHQHLQKIAQILDAAKKAKDAGNNNVDVADILIGDKFKISIDTNNNESKLLIKDTNQAGVGTDIFTLKSNGSLEYTRNTTPNAYNQILLNFKVAGADTEVASAIDTKKADADVTKAKALIREAIDTVLNTDMDKLKAYDAASQDADVKGHIKKILELAKDEKLSFLDNNGQGIESEIDLGSSAKGKIVLKKTSDGGAELDIIYDSTGDSLESEDKKNKFVLNNNDITFTEASGHNSKLKDLAAVDGVKDKIKQALDKQDGKLKFTTEEIAKAKAKAEAYKLLKDKLSTELLASGKIDALINAGDGGVVNAELKKIVDKAKEVKEDIELTINSVNNKNITLTIKANGTSIEISADNKKDTITLDNDKFKIATDNKVAISVLQELAKSKTTLGDKPFAKAIAEAKKLIPKEGDHALTQDEIDKRKTFLDAVYIDDQNNALKTILGAISNQDLTTANTDEAILNTIDQAGKDKIKLILEKAVVAGNDYITSLDLTATINGATVKLEIVDNKPALTIEKDNKKDTFKLADNNTLEYTSAKTATKDSVLHLLSNFDPANLNDKLSVLIAKNGGEITSQNITAGNIEDIVDTADDAEKALKVAEATLTAINAGEKATAQKVKTLEEKAAAATKAKEEATKAKETAEQAKVKAEAEAKKPDATDAQKVAAQKALKDAEAKLEAAEDKLDEAKDVAEDAATELEIAKKAQDAAKGAVGADATKKAEAIKKAKENVENISKQVDVLNDALAETNVNTVKANDALKEKQTALTVAQKAYDEAEVAQKAEKLKELNKAKEEVAEAKEEVGDANADRAERATRKLDSTTKQIASSLGDISADNKVLKDLFLADGTKKEDIVKVVENVTSSVTTSVDSMAKISNVDIIKFNTDLSTATRLASLSNPFNADLALASAIKHLKDDSFASSDDSALS
uniref:hypothetical protein n=1 Tax=Campylobacter pinnipediorum TaxID=1965231 RepID=UPI0018E98DC0